jgi:hypothetical protein
VLLVTLMVGAVLAVAGTAPADAQGPEPGEAAGYTVRAVATEAEAADPAAARDQAIAAGQVKALQEVMRRITDPADHGRLPPVDASTARGMVETYSLAAERTTDTAYRANMTVEFNGDAVRGLLRTHGIAFAASASAPVLVVPVYQSDPLATALLWEDTNPWLTAWRHQDSGNMLMPLEVPTGDLRDVTSITAEEALVPDSTALDRLISRYGHSRVLVAHAVRTAPNMQTVSLNYGSPRAMARTGKQTIQRGPDEDDAAFLIRAATELARRMESDWRQATMVRGGAARQATALVTLGGFDDWVTIRRVLEQSPLVSDMRVQAMSREMAQLTLTVLGDIGQVGAALASEGLTLTERGGYWMIGRANTAGYGPGPGAGSPYPGDGSQGAAPQGQGSGYGQAPEYGGTATTW